MIQYNMKKKKLLREMENKTDFADGTYIILVHQ